MSQIVSSSMGNSLHQKFLELGYVSELGVFDPTPFDVDIDLKSIKDLPNVPDGAVMVDILSETITSFPVDTPKNTIYEIGNTMTEIKRLYDYLLQSTLETPTTSVTMVSTFDVHTI